MKARFLLEIDVPNGASLIELRDYITEEVKVGCGSRRPEDPIFNLDRDSVKLAFIEVVK